MNDIMDINRVQNMADWRVFTDQNGVLYVTILAPHNDGFNNGVMVLTSTGQSNTLSKENHYQMYHGHNVRNPFWLEMNQTWLPGVCMHNYHALKHAPPTPLGTVRQYAMKNFRSYDAFLAKYCVITEDDETMYTKLHKFICEGLGASYFQYVTSGFNLEVIWGLDVYFRTETHGMEPPTHEAKYLGNWYQNRRQPIWPTEWYRCDDLLSVGQQKIPTMWTMEEYGHEAVQLRARDYLQKVLTLRQLPTPGIRIFAEERKKEELALRGRL